MNKINCLIPTPKYRDIAKSLNLDPTIVTNLASVYLSENPTANDVTLENIQSMLNKRKEAKEEAYLAIPMYIPINEEVGNNKPLASTNSETGVISLRTLPKDKGIEYFFDYIQGNLNNPTSTQKKAVFDRLIESKQLKDIDELRQLLQTPYEVYQFLLWHKMSHVQSEDSKVYWNNGKDLMTQDKIDIEYRATLDALNKAKEYRKSHPNPKGKQKKKQTENKQTPSTKYYTGNITNEDPNTIFVFGSNPEGRHGAGAAKVAVDNFEAIYGQGEGLQGNAYALPTKDLRVKENNSLRSISPSQITESIKRLYETAKQNPDKQFKIAFRNTNDATLNGYTGYEMIQMFKDAGDMPTNIIISEEWYKTGLFNTNQEQGTNQPSVLSAQPQIQPQPQVLPQLQPQTQPQPINPISKPNIGLERIQVNKESPIVKISSAFTPQQRRDRIDLIARMFSEEVTGVLEELIDNTQEELTVAVAQEDWVLQYKLRELLNTLTDPVKGRQAAINHITVEKIVANIQESFQELLEDSENDAYLKQQYQNIIDNFEYLLNQATFKIEYNENLKLSFSKTVKHKDKENTEVLGGTVEAVPETLDDDGREPDDDDEYGNRATGNDGWSFKVRMTDPHKTLSKTTKRILSQLIKLDNITGEPEYDDLGNYRYLDGQYAHAVLISKLSDMIDDSDFCEKHKDEDGNIMYDLPALEALAKKYKWVEQIINDLRDNPTKVSAFYADLRKDFIPYWSSITKTVEEENSINKKQLIVSNPLNKASEFDSAKNQIIDNYETGTPIDKDSIYDNNRMLNKEHIAIGLQLLNDIDLQEVEEDEYEEVSKHLAKLVKMVGLKVEPIDIQSLWETPSGDITIKDIHSTLTYIFNRANTIADKKEAHLISECNTDFNKLARYLGEITELDAVSSFRDNDKTYQSYSAPNMINTQFKLFTTKDSIRRGKYLQEEFQDVDFFYDSDKSLWKGSTKDKPCWLELIDKDEDVRDNMEIKELLSLEGLQYSEWTKYLIQERFVLEYFSPGYNAGSKKQFGYYNFPIFSDSPIAMMIKMPRYTENVEEEIIPRLRQVVIQELERIKLVEDRAKKGISPIACYDSKRGKSFCFFPFLNTWKDKDGVLFRNKIAELKDQGIDAINTFIDGVLKEYMQNEFLAFADDNFFTMDNLVNNGIAENEADALEKLKEYFYNHHYAETQIIQLTVTDLAFYKNGVDFQKRYKEVYASGTRLNTQSKYGREYERTVYLKDNIIVSSNYTDIKSALNAAKKQWISRGMDAEIAEMSVDSILHKFRDINVADAQAYRSLSSFRAVLDMLGAWSDEMQEAFDRIQGGVWSMKDFNVLWTTIKPFVYSQIVKDSGIDNKQIKIPHQNKNSEFLLLSMYQLIATSMNKSPQLKAINKFMEDKNIDVVQFESAVKSGNEGTIDITYSEEKLKDWIKENKDKFEEIVEASNIEEGTSNIKYFRQGNENLLDDGKITQEEYNKRMESIIPSYDETYQTLLKYAFNSLGGYNTHSVHIIPYKDYMIAQPSTEHFFDREEMSTAVFGSQFRNLIVSDISEDAIIKVNGHEYTKQELLNLYNALIVENLMEDYNNVSKRFKSTESFQKALLNTVKGNPKYGKNIIDALQLIDWTDPNTGETKKIFNIPIYSPSIATQIQDVVNSMFKNAVTKQKIKGAACVLVSNFGFTDRLKIKYKKDGDVTSGVDYVPCYLPWYSKKYFEPFLKTVTKNGVTYQEIDIQKVPKDLLEMIGYRIPTENKYSMLPLRVVGFLPQQNGNCIMLPADVTTLSGSDSVSEFLPL